MTHLETCQLCGGSKFIPLDLTAPEAKGAAANVRWATCVSCSYIFQNPRPDPEFQERLYAESLYRAKKGETGIDRGYVSFAPMQLLRVAHWLAMNGLDLTQFSGRTCLDYGCGIGGALYPLAMQGNKAYGVELDRVLAEFGNQNFNIDIVPRLADLPQGLTFDLIVAHHSLEHVYDPNEFFAYAAEHLAPDGTILIAVPAWRYATTPKGNRPCDECNSMWDHVALANFLNKYGFYMNSNLYQNYGPGGDWELVATAVRSKASNCYTFNLNEVLEELYSNIPLRRQSTNQNPLPAQQL